MSEQPRGFSYPYVTKESLPTTPAGSFVTRNVDQSPRRKGPEASQAQNAIQSEESLRCRGKTASTRPNTLHAVEPKPKALTLYQRLRACCGVKVEQHDAPLLLPGLSREQQKTLVIQQQYDEKRTLQNLMHFRGTCLAGVVFNPWAWIFIIVHWVLYALRRADETPCPATENASMTSCNLFGGAFKDALKENPLSMGDISVMVSLTTFLVVFYNGSCFQRYNMMYAEAMAITAKLHNTSMFLRVYFLSPTTRWNVLRYLVASHHIFYWSLRKRSYDWQKKDACPDDPGDISNLMRTYFIPRGLLIKPEVHMQLSRPCPSTTLCRCLVLKFLPAVSVSACLPAPHSLALLSNCHSGLAATSLIRLPAT